jgi:hypothetical protein
MVNGKHVEEVIPPRPCRSPELLGGNVNLGGVRASSHEKGKLGLHNPEPYIGV